MGDNLLFYLVLKRRKPMAWRSTSARHLLRLEVGRPQRETAVPLRSEFRANHRFVNDSDLQLFFPVGSRSAVDIDNVYLLRKPTKRVTLPFLKNMSGSVWGWK